MNYFLILTLFFSLNTYAVIDIGEVIDPVEINELKNKSEYKRKCVTKVLQSNIKYEDLNVVISSNSKYDFLDDLKVTGLTIGKRYEVEIEAYLLNVRVSQHEIYIYNSDNSLNNFLTKLRLYNNSSTYNHIEFGKEREFIAQTNSISVRYAINSGSVSVYTDSGQEPQLIANNTKIKVCEANHREDVLNF